MIKEKPGEKMKKTLLQKDAQLELDSDNGADEIPVRSLSGVNIGLMARQKQEITQQINGAERELHELKRRQEELEKEKNELSELGRKQNEYETGKRDISARLAKAIDQIERQEERVTRLQELLSVMRARFQDTLSEVRGLNEESWPDESFEMELNKALVVVEDAKAVYRKGLAKIDAADWERADADSAAALQRALPRESGVPRGFLFWLKAGFAFCLPVCIVMIALTIAYFFWTGGFGI